ncbi:MAG: hypothetical protein AAF581_10305 [Planctomycetota bacterium]
MAIRTKGRASFDYHGRAFVWHVRDDRWLVVASEDKRFVVHYPLCGDAGVPPVLMVVGQDFPRAPQLARPGEVEAPVFAGPALGGTVAALLDWCFARPGDDDT